MSFALHGTSVSPGITIGSAHLVSSARLEVAHYEIDAAAVPGELARFATALAQVRDELGALEGHIPHDAPAEISALVNLHRLILDDPALAEQPRELIVAEHCNAEWALVQQLEKLVAQFDEIEDAYLRERKSDVQ